MISGLEGMMQIGARPNSRREPKEPVYSLSCCEHVVMMKCGLAWIPGALFRIYQPNSPWKLRNLKFLSSLPFTSKTYGRWRVYHYG